MKRKYSRKIHVGLRVQQAESLICRPRQGGFFDHEGNGQAWRDGDHQWSWSRKISKGQWAGAWKRKAEIVVQF